MTLTDPRTTFNSILVLVFPAPGHCTAHVGFHADRIDAQSFCAVRYSIRVAAPKPLFVEYARTLQGTLRPM